MARSTAFRSFSRIAAMARYADRNGLPTAEAIERFRAQKERARLLRPDPSRRSVLKGLGAAALVGATLQPRRAFATRVDKQGAVVAVVGGGLAGLSCAYELAGSGVNVTVFEAGGANAGRVRSYGGAFGGSEFPGQVVELGAELIDTTHTTMRGYATEFGLTLEDYDKEPGEVFFYADGRVTHEAEVVDEYRAFTYAMGDDLRDIGAPTADPATWTPQDEAFDWMTLEDYLDTRGAGPVLRDVLEAAYVGEYGAQLDEQSSLNFLLFAHADRSSKFREFGVFSDERFHVVGGNQQIPDALRAALGGAIVNGSRLVAATTLSDGRYELTFETDGGGVSTFTADFVVFAMPFSTLRQVDLTGLSLPAEKQLAVDQWVYGRNTKTMIGFQGRPWQALGNNGGVYSTLPNATCVWETSAAMASALSGVLTDYAGGLRAEGLVSSQLQAQVAATLADLEVLLPGITAQARQVGGQTQAVLENWFLSPLHLGSYTNNAPGYFTTLEGLARPRVGNLLFAGEHTDSFYEWQGFMEGAANSGIAAATEILGTLRSPKF